MPCRDYGYDRQASSRAYDDMHDMHDMLDELSRHACLFATALSYELDRLKIDLTVTSLIKILIDAGEPTDPKFVREAVGWWIKHRKADLAARKDAEREASLKRRGTSLVAKLSKNDREALAAIGVAIPARAVAVGKEKVVPMKTASESKPKSKK